MPRKKKQQQTRLTFEPVGSSESPGKTVPANVRLTKGVAASGSSSRASSQRTTSTLSRPGPSQKAQSPMKLPKAIPKTSFMSKAQGFKRPPISNDSADDSAGEVEEENAFPKSSQSISTMLRQTGFDTDDAIIAGGHDTDADVAGGDDDDDDDEPIILLSTRKRARPKYIELEDSSDGAISPVKKSKTSQAIPDRLKKSAPVVSSPKHRHSKSHRTEKQKKIELLRRRRAGEKIDRVTSSEDSEEEKRGIYDSDSDGEFGALKEFDDEEESDKEEIEAPTRQASKTAEKHRKGSQNGSQDEGDDDLDNFVVDDDDGPLGAPANLDIPLEFTAQAHRPLKEQFPYVIEWLVHHRIDPAFDRNDPVYTNAWRKLNDEVQGLASSKFASSAWKPEFHRALKGRPNILIDEMTPLENGLYDVCEACGRSRHPPTRVISFSGHPYYKDTLGEVESESTSDSDAEPGENEDDASDHESIDSQGVALPPVKKKWYVGIICCNNAETAHGLIHWKHALKEWVEEQLQIEGWMNANKLKERERMRDGKRRKLANKIVDGWRGKKIIMSLYRDFKATLEDARRKPTTGRPHNYRFG